MRSVPAILAVLASLSVAACAGGESASSGATETSSTTAADSEAPVEEDVPAEEDARAEPGPGEMARADWDDEWPLTVDSGTVRCEKGLHVLFEADGTTYAANGTAMTQRPELPRIQEIWADSPDMPGLKIDISPVLDTGLALCD
jgi:hypothetical protein